MERVIDMTKQVVLTEQEKLDYMFHALAYMGNASSQMSWANNCVEDVSEIPEELKSDMKKINVEIYRIQEQIRAVRNGETT
jgi:hypothetical protein